MAFDLSTARPVGDVPAAPAAPAGFDPATALPAGAPGPSAANRNAPTSGVLMGLRDPIDAGAQMLPRALGAITSLFGLAPNRVSEFMDREAGRVDGIVKDTNAGYEASRVADALPVTEKPGFDWARLGGNMINPANWLGGGVIKGGSTALQLAGAGAKAGALSGALQPVLDTENFWTEKGKQATVGAVSGAVLTPAITKGVTGAANAVTKSRGALERRAAQQAVDPQQIRIAVTNTITSQGMRPADLPDVVLRAVERDVAQALRTGSRVDPSAILRKAQFEAVGLVDDAGPTVGQLTRDTNPMNFANEKNMSGILMDRGARGMGNDLADRIQTQNARLGENLDNMGARDATDRFSAGNTIMQALRDYDAPIEDAVSGLYQSARSMADGRVVDLDRAAFSKAANEALDSGQLGHLVPPNIRSILNDITSGKSPFNVETEATLHQIMSKAQREAQRKGEDNAAVAIGAIRNALNDTPFAQPSAGVRTPTPNAAAEAARTVDEGVTDVTARMAQPEALPSGQKGLPAPASTALATDMPAPPLRQGGALSTEVTPPAPTQADVGDAAREAYAQARRAARNRFATIDDVPALKAALDDTSPDEFIKKFVTGAKDSRDVQALTRILESNPEARDQARAQVADHLKRAAFRENPSGTKEFKSDAYLGAIRAIGPAKLRAFFTEAELVRLNLAGKVASDINSIPSGAKYATNTSGTAAAVMNLLSKFGAKFADAVPVIGPTAKAVVGAVGDKIGAVKTQATIDKALNPAAEKITRELSPQARRLIEAPASAIGVTAGAATAAAATSRDGEPDMARAKAIRADFRAGKITKAEAVKRLNDLGMQ